ncbi:6,7-dimethyl-8-ribityllumazine synthase [Hydromonas duriensis]|uniref:6,7-dimethyl-8-ribityllumazine synthase n=1 Tax=Hydromonas duriensis TaxID=1527608 RepID=A0A4R6Y954_9BURK|nr:6,7-dimethyl-8-ribityllumazine synthase [Hydromonas duriensis]TDR31970.1 6,7-dimethyl-8-ribityllumazine synthase [Hydromonas duriensis]
MIEQFKPEISGKDLRIGIVQARFNEDICNALLNACVTELMAQGVLEEDILYITVPGALEVPLALQMMCQSEEFDALIALGAVVRGETYHFDLVSNESGAGVTRVSLDHNMPIANAILTVENDEQAFARVQEKGADAARVAIEMACLYEGLDEFIGFTTDEENA